MEAAVASAQAQVDQTREALTRAEQLLERGVSTRAQLEAAQAEFRVAEANLRSQQEQLRIGQVGGRPEDIVATEAGLEAIDAQLIIAQDALADATLTAPFDGIVARRDIENFTNVQAGQSIALLQGLDVVHLAFDIPGPDVTDLTRNGPGEITNTAVFDSLPGQVFDAETVEFSVQADSATQTYRGRVAVEVPEGSITETRSRTRSPLTRSVTHSFTKSHPRSLLSMAMLNSARSRREFASSSRARIAQTCLGSSGRFWPMIRPLFQALRFRVTAGNRTLGMICPPIHPPHPIISTAPTPRL